MGDSEYVRTLIELWTWVVKVTRSSKLHRQRVCSGVEKWFYLLFENYFILLVRENRKIIYKKNEGMEKLLVMAQSQKYGNVLIREPLSKSMAVNQYAFFF